MSSDRKQGDSTPLVGDLWGSLVRASAATDDLTGRELSAIRDLVDDLLHSEGSPQIAAAVSVRANMPRVRAACPESAEAIQRAADEVLAVAWQNNLVKPLGLKEAVDRVGEENLRRICNYSRALREGDPATQIQAAKLLRQDLDLARAVWPQFVPQLEARISQTLLRLN
jgi:hypothetical protein